MEFEKIKAPEHMEFQTPDAMQSKLLTANPQILSQTPQSQSLRHPAQSEEQQISSQPLIQQSLTENAALSARSLKQHPASPIAVSAQGSPQQMFVPVKKSRKQRRANASHLKEVRKKTHSHEVTGDLASYSMRENLLQKQKEDSRRKAVPYYKKDYSSEPQKIKNAFLESFTKEMLDIRLDMDMFAEEYMEKHTASLKELYDRIAAFKQIWQDAANQDFFNQMPDADSHLLRTRIQQLTAFSDLLDTQFACKCVSLNGQYNTPQEQQKALQEADERKRAFLTAAQQYDLEKQALDHTQEQNAQYAKPEAIFTPDSTVQLTKAEAISSYSDQLSRQKRGQLTKILSAQSASMKSIPCMKAVITAAENYTKGDRYTVGYTQERQLLQKALQAIKDARASKIQDAPSIAMLNSLESYFDSLTNGTLSIPNDAKILDYSGQSPKESGSIQHGSSRNAAIRAFSYWSNQKDTPLFSHEPTVNDLKQRLVSNCYMVAATAGLVHLAPEVLKSCIKDNLDGSVTVRLYQKKYRPSSAADTLSIHTAKKASPSANELDLDEFLADADEMKQHLQQTREREATAYYEPIYIRVSKEIPRIAGADALSAGALWMQMIEKACAFLGRDNTKGYKSLWYGEGGSFLERLLGIPTNEMNMDKKEDLFLEICNARQNQKIFNTGTLKNVGSDDGLNAGHAYTIMGGKEINGKRYVLLRNPYSTMSLQYQKDGTSTRTGHMLDTHSDETYGQFYMEYEEFLLKFGRISCTDLSKAQSNTSAE